MPEGICTKCGRQYAGWALRQPEHHVCKCGGKIEIQSENDRTQGTGKRIPALIRA
jgi:hypothetical protein